MTTSVQVSSHSPLLSSVFFLLLLCGYITHINYITCMCVWVSICLWVFVCEWCVCDVEVQDLCWDYFSIILYLTLFETESPIRLFFPSQLPWGSLISAFEARIIGGSPHPHSIHMGAWDLNSGFSCWIVLPAPSMMVYGPQCRSLQLSWLNPLPSILFCGHHVHGMAFLTFFPHYIKTCGWFVCSYRILWLRWIHLLAVIVFFLYVFLWVSIYM